MEVFEKQLEAINSVKKKFFLLQKFLSTSQNIFIAALAFYFWSFISPEKPWEALIIGLVVLGIASAYNMYTSRFYPIVKEELTLSLDIQFPEAKSPIYLAGENAEAWNENWASHFKQFLEGVRKEYIKKVLTTSKWVGLTFLVLCVVWTLSSSSLSKAIVSSIKKSGFFNNTTKLFILQGADDSQKELEFSLSPRKTPEIKLLAPNLIQVTVTNSSFAKPPLLILKNNEGLEKDKVYQSFQLTETENNITGEKNYSLKFSTTQSGYLMIPAINASQALAQFTIKSLPLPEVLLSTVDRIVEPWSDDKPVRLNIMVHGKNPLQLIQLIIRSGGRETKELVHTIGNDTTLDLNTNYTLILESYVNDDLAEVEIVAMAQDRAYPTPLTGFSKPLRIRTVSAYGRYRQSLTSLKNIKTSIDEALANKNPEQLPKDSTSMMDKALEEAMETPFFDTMDRLQMNSINEVLRAHAKKSLDLPQMYDLSSAVNSFLEEHEMLDDRERDRDFFVAARGLSRIVEQISPNKNTTVEGVSKHIQTFLDDRYLRWQKRVERLEEKEKLPFWKELSANNFFKTSIAKTQKLAQTERSDEALTELSKNTSDFRQWIEALEKQEDEERANREKKRQEGVTSAKEELKALQKRQTSVSKKLDQAETRKEDIENNWPTTKMEQSTNEKETGNLSQKVKQFSKEASERLDAAKEAMQMATEKGNAKEYGQAESFADLASRLLLKAESSAEKSQNNQGGSKERRRRRTTGDNYYGQAVHGGDIEINRDYQVERRYREDILQETTDSPDAQEGGDRQLIENYLRKIVR